MTREEAKKIFLNRGYIEVPGGTYYDADKWRNAVAIISKWLEQQPCEDAVSREAVKSALCELCGDKRSCPFVNGDCDDLNTIDALPSVISKEKTGHCKDCKWWKDNDGVYRRGIGAESKCPMNCKKVYEGNGYCFLFEPQESA